MNKKFESVAIIRSKIGEQRAKECYERVKEYLEENGILDKAEFIGKKKLAYEISNNKEGYYVQFFFKEKNRNNLVSSLEELYRTDDDILKFIVLGVDEITVYDELRNKIHDAKDVFTSLEKAMAYYIVKLAEKSEKEITFEKVSDIAYSLSNNFTLNEFIENFIKNELSELNCEEEEDCL